MIIVFTTLTYKIYQLLTLAARPSSTAATTTAQAPVPQASVAPILVKVKYTVIFSRNLVYLTHQIFVG